MYTIKLKDWLGFELNSIDMMDSEFNGGQPITQVELDDWAKQAYNKFKKTVVILKDGKQVASYSMLNEN